MAISFFGRSCRTIEKGGGGGRGGGFIPLFSFQVESENIKPLHVNNMGDFSLFVEQDISDKKWISFF